MISQSPDDSDDSLTADSSAGTLGMSAEVGPDAPTVGMSSTSTPHPGTPLSQVGDYRICRELGRGGMGIVYEATELSLQRQVALKILPSAAHLDSMRARRFRNESRAAAQLNHPNIIPVYAVGAADGISYFAMHLVDGKDLGRMIRNIRRDLDAPKPESNSNRPQIATTINDTSPTSVATKPKSRTRSSAAHRGDSEEHSRMELSAADFNSRSGRHSTTYRAAATVARLGIRVADALQHAHDTGIVHRDIKPANLMIDNQGKVWVTDFGLAHIRDSPSMTRTGDMLGTLRYMSPEQATGVRALIDHRTDIYSLGVTLCEILTLQRIVQGESNEEVLKEVVYGAPVRVRRIDPGVPEDMAIILEKAMSKNPLERYATAGEMAEDLHRFLRNEAIRAKRPSLLKRCAQWFGRHRSIAAAVLFSLGFIFFASILATAVVAMAWQSEAQQLVKTKKALSVSEGLRMLLNASSIVDESPGLSQALALQGAPAVPGFEANQTLLAASDANHEYASLAPREVPSTQVTVSSDGTLAVTCADRTNVPSPALLHSMRDGSVLRQLDAGNIVSAIFSPSGAMVITETSGTGTSSGQVTAWEAATARKIQVFPDSALGLLRSGVFSSDGAKLVLCQGNEASIVTLNDNQRVVLRGHTAAVAHAEFSPDNQKILTVATDKSIRVWDSVTGREVRPAIEFATQQPAQAHFTANSTHILVRDKDAIKLYAVDAGPEELGPVAKGPSLFMTPSRSQDQAALYGIHSVRMVSSENLERICEIDLGAETIQRVHFHPTQKQVIVSCGPVMYLFDSETGERLGEFRGHTSSVLDAEFAASAPVLASVAGDRTLRLWHTQSGYQQRSFETPPSAYHTLKTLSSTNPDDTLIAVYPELSYRTSVRSADGSPIGISMSGVRGAGTVDCQHLVIVQGRIVKVIEADTSRQIFRGVFSDTLTSSGTQMVDSGGHLLVHTQTGEVYLVDLESGSRRLMSEPGIAVTNVYASPEHGVSILISEMGGKGRAIAISSTSGKVTWDQRHDVPIARVQLHPNGELLAMIDAAGTTQFWAIGEDWDLLTAIPPGERPVDRIAFVGEGFVTWHSRTNSQLRYYSSLESPEFQEYPAVGRVSVDTSQSFPHIAIGSADGAVLWNPANQDTTSLTERACSKIRLTEDSIGLLLARNDKESPELQLRSRESGEVTYSEPLELAPWSLDFDPAAERWVLTESGYAANLFHYDSSAFAYSSSPHASSIIWAGFSMTLNRFVTVSADGTVLVSDDTGKLLHRIDHREQPITTATLDAKGEALLVGTQSGDLLMWSMADGSEMARLEGHKAPIRSIRFDASGNKAISVAEGEPVRLWDLRQRSSQEILVEAALHAEISSGGGHALIVAADDQGRASTAWLVDVATGQKSDVTQRPLGTRCVGFSPDGQYFGLLRGDRRLQILRVADRSVACEFAAPGGTIRFAFSPDGTQILTASSDAYTLWAFPDGSKLLQVAGRRGPRYDLNAQWQPFSRNNQLFHSDSLPAKHPRNPQTFADSLSQRELSQDERSRFHLDLAEVSTN